MKFLTFWSDFVISLLSSGAAAAGDGFVPYVFAISPSLSIRGAYLAKTRSRQAPKAVCDDGRGGGGCCCDAFSCYTHRLSLIFFDDSLLPMCASAALCWLRLCARQEQKLKIFLIPLFSFSIRCWESLVLRALEKDGTCEHTEEHHTRVYKELFIFSQKVFSCGTTSFSCWLLR